MHKADREAIPPPYREKRDAPGIVLATKLLGAVQHAAYYDKDSITVSSGRCTRAADCSNEREENKRKEKGRKENKIIEQ